MNVVHCVVAAVLGALLACGDDAAPGATTETDVPIDSEATPLFDVELVDAETATPESETATPETETAAPETEIVAAETIAETATAETEIVAAETIAETVAPEIAEADAETLAPETIAEVAEPGEVVGPLEIVDAETTNPETSAEVVEVVDAIEVGPEVVEPGPVTVSRAHWRLAFEDDFRGKTGKPSDDYCFDVLEPQCHIWSGGNFDCDLEQDTSATPIRPLRENFIAALRLFDPNRDYDAMSLPDIKASYSQLIRERLADLDKCTWTLYMMVNWMATDYQGHWSARFDPTQVTVDASGKGVLRLFATRAPVDTSCVFGGGGGNPNCQIHGFAAGVLTPGVNYWVDPDPRWAGVYYAPINGQCSHGGSFTGVNCLVYSFPPNTLEARDVAYWADPDPRWPGVYYANQAYACRDNVDYSPSLGFRNLTCPILNGGLMSYPPQHASWIDDAGTTHAGGVAQKFGRFEAKARIPKGQGAFPATWLMPLEGGWPYDGGEIDVMEARDAADEVYQTFHSGRCYLAATQQEIDANDAADCASKGGVTTHMSKGFTTAQPSADAFWKRFHLFAVEWSERDGGRLDYYINDVKIGSIAVGTIANLTPGAPASLAAYSAENFPTSPFYWILNHSTWVAPDKQAAFAQQTFEIDYVRNYIQCGTDPAEYCPRGGAFIEGTGCVGADVRTYPSPCQPAARQCANGGVQIGDDCKVWDFAPGQIVAGVTYWVDPDPNWPGVYYNMVDGGCPHGGSGTVNCQVVALPEDVLETGVGYRVDRINNAILYTPEFQQ